LRQGLVLFCCQAFELLDRDEVTAEIFRAEKGVEEGYFRACPPRERQSLSSNYVPE
jgi:hypothetical protein